MEVVAVTTEQHPRATLHHGIRAARETVYGSCGRKSGVARGQAERQCRS